MHAIDQFLDSAKNILEAVTEGATRVLAQCKESWAREAIEESLIDDDIKAEIL